jgi:hypothetical protein
MESEVLEGRILTNLWPPSGTTLATLSSGIVCPGPTLHPSYVQPTQQPVSIAINPHYYADRRIPIQPPERAIEASNTSTDITRVDRPYQSGIGDNREIWNYHTPFASAEERELQVLLFEAWREERVALKAAEAARNRATELQSLILLERVPQNASDTENRSAPSPPPLLADEATSDIGCATRHGETRAQASSGVQQEQAPSRLSSLRSASLYADSMERLSGQHPQQGRPRASSNPERPYNEHLVDHGERPSPPRPVCVLCRDNPATVQHPVLTGGALICEPCFNDALLAAAQAIGSQERNS